MRDVISSRPVLNAALATLGLTTIHHVYGGLVYGTPWRLHGSAVAIAIGAALIVLSILYNGTHRKVFGYVLGAAVLLMPVLGTGLFEGGYNHLLKNVLFAVGAPRDLMLRMFPPPTYELPNDAFFEVTGIAQIIPAAFAALASIRFLRALRRTPRCTRPACNTHFALRALISVSGEPVEIPDIARYVHLQFRRFAGCPVCNLHLRSFVRRNGELAAAGVREVVVFHSPADQLREHVAGMPFDVIPDPDKRLYRAMGVEASSRALLDPRAWGTILIAVARSTIAILRGRERPPALVPHGGRFGLPADFLIDSRGRVVACKHGTHVDDAWSVDDVLAIVRGPEVAIELEPVSARR